MRRITPLNVVAALAVVGLIAATVAFAVSAHATPQPAAAHSQTFRQALAAKLGTQLHKPAADVLAALKQAKRQRPAHRRPATRAQRLARRQARRDAWAAAVAKPLAVAPADVTAALRALVAERLASLVAQNWITADRSAELLACFDDTTKCARRTRPLGLAFLRQGV